MVLDLQRGIVNVPLPTRLPPPIINETFSTFVVGTAPIFMATGTPAPVGEVIRISNLNEMKERLGYNYDFGRYTLCEAAFMFFENSGIGPLYMVNVFDPSNTTEGADFEGALINGSLTLPAGSIVEDVRVGENVAIKGTDYILSYSSITGEPIITRLKASTVIPTDSTQITVQNKFIAASFAGVNDADVAKGFNELEIIYPKTETGSPEVLIAPGFGHQPLTYAAMQKYTDEESPYGGRWFATAIIDIPDDAENADVLEKVENVAKNYTIPGYGEWARWAFGGANVHGSVVKAAILARGVAQNSGVPRGGGSNEVVANCTGLYNGKGERLYMDLKPATIVNNSCVNTGLYSQGYRTLGNRLLSNRNSDEVSHVWGSFRIARNHIFNTFQRDLINSVDQNMGLGMIEGLVTQINITLNRMSKAKAIEGNFEVVLNRELNTAETLDNGKVIIDVIQGKGAPAEGIIIRTYFDLELGRSWVTQLIGGN